MTGCALKPAFFSVLSAFFSVLSDTMVYPSLKSHFDMRSHHFKIAQNGPKWVINSVDATVYHRPSHGVFLLRCSYLRDHGSSQETPLAPARNVFAVAVCKRHEKRGKMHNVSIPAGGSFILKSHIRPKIRLFDPLYLTP